MPRTDFDRIDCSIARTMSILGQPWTALILRDLFIGISRFDQLREHLGVSRKVLTERLAHLVAVGIVDRQAYTERPPRFDYHLTERGWELCDVLLVITAWGDRWTTSSDGPPASIRHISCGAIVTAELTCSHCTQPLSAAQVQVIPRR